MSKPGYKTTEFWLSSLVTLVGIVLASGAIAEGGTIAQILGGVLTVLAMLGYSGSRTAIKKAEAGQGTPLTAVLAERAAPFPYGPPPPAPHPAPAHTPHPDDTTPPPR